MKWTPFTAYISVTPAEGKRFVYIRSLQKIAAETYTSLAANANINIAKPGGGQHQTLTGNNETAMSQLVYGTGIKPQFGDNPAQLMITGFYSNNNNNSSPHSEIDIFSGNEEYTGAQSAPQVNMPSTNVNNEVKSLRAILDAAIAYPNLPTDANAKVYRLDYNGIIFGNRGYHFPR